MKLDKKPEDFVKDETINEAPKTIAKPKKYVITVTNLALREGPGKDYDKIGIADAGQTLIDNIENDFGHLADGSGWVSMQYTRKVD